MSMTPIPNPIDANFIGRVLAAWLFPFIVAEGKARKAAKAAAVTPTSGNAPAAGSNATPYTQQQCTAFVAGLSPNLLRRMRDMFMLLRASRIIGSQEMLTKVPEAKTASGLAATLTNHVKRRAKSLNLPYPWKVALDVQGRVTWEDDGVTAARMVEAIETEQARRQPPPATP